jgi:hypothetical protein
VEKSQGKRQLEEPEVYGRIILKLIFMKLVGCINWINLAQDRDRWWALVIAVMNFRIP